MSGSTPARPGNCSFVASASVAGATSVGACSSAVKAARSSTVDHTSLATDPRSSLVAMPSGASTASWRYSPAVVPERGRQGGAERLEPGVAIDPSPARRRWGWCPRRAGPRRAPAGGAPWRRAAPPVHRGRGSPPRRRPGTHRHERLGDRAMWVCQPVGPAVARTPSGPTTAPAAVVTGQVASTSRAGTAGHASGGAARAGGRAPAGRVHERSLCPRRDLTGVAGHKRCGHG